MADFETADKITQRNEGGWQNDPDDLGNSLNGLGTYRGIASAKQSGWRGWSIIKATLASMTKQPHYGTGSYYAWVATLNKILAANATLQAQVDAFYKANFWDVNRLGELHSQGAANHAYDHGVNRGTGTAAILLQRCLGVMADGEIGPVTIAAANKLSDAEMERRYRAARKADYRRLIEKNPKQAKYEPVWLARC